MIYHGDLFDVLPTLAAESVDACVTDPPYELAFMGKAWDGTGVAFSVATWVEVLRVLKPGAHLVAFGGTRTFHRLTAGIEDAGFEIRDCLSWLYGSGFPKSLNLPRGLGTALKPSWEPCILARKPTRGTVAANVAQHGTGAINVDACRIGETKNVPASISKHAARARGVYDGNRDGSWGNEIGGPGSGHDPNTGRWPANVLLDEGAATALDEQTGELVSGANPTRRGSDKVRGIYSEFKGQTECKAVRGVDAGGASRFYYVAKPSREERDMGCYGLPSLSALDTVERDPASAGANNPRAGAGRLSVLNTSEIVYTDPVWVNAVLTQRLPADTETFRPKVIGASTVQCADGSAWSMCWCGSPSTDPFHPVVRSIIETETNSITPSRISNSSRRPHTNGCMAAAFGVLADGGSLAAYAEFQSPWARLIGTSRKKAGHSTADAVPATSIASWLTSAPAKPANPRRNGHPTVKPVELMRWLVRLVTPPGGTVLDPFTGSGTTGMACAYELRPFIGIEREAEYVEIAERRIAAVAPLFSEATE
jgi:DNA modification methylase